VSALSYTIEIDGAPAPPALLAAVRQIEVEQHADLADMLRLRLGISVREGREAWTVVDDDTFKRLTNITVGVSVGGASPRPLIDGYVVDLRADFSAEPGGATLDVVAMDATVLMDLEEKARAWPDMSDSAIAASIFGEHGFAADVTDTATVHDQRDHTTIQRDTDIAFLRRLAARHGFECGVSPALHGGTRAHFRPPPLDEEPQAVLSVNLGTATNVDGFTARYDLVRPVTASVTGLDAAAVNDQSGSADATAQRALGRVPSTGSDRPRTVLLSHTGLANTGELQTLAQAVVDASAFAVSAQGRVNGAASGLVLDVTRPVLVRGAGAAFSGPYAVERVLHVLSADAYVEQVGLRRNAAGLTGVEDFRGSEALPSADVVRP
jgi:phage protein D